jgi:hypothetical protein
MVKNYPASEAIFHCFSSADPLAAGQMDLRKGRSSVVDESLGEAVGENLGEAVGRCLATKMDQSPETKVDQNLRKRPGSRPPRHAEDDLLGALGSTCPVPQPPSNRAQSLHDCFPVLGTPDGLLPYLGVPLRA